MVWESSTEGDNVQENSERTTVTSNAQSEVDTARESDTTFTSRENERRAGATKELENSGELPRMGLVYNGNEQPASPSADSIQLPSGKTAEPSYDSNNELNAVNFSDGSSWSKGADGRWNIYDADGNLRGHYTDVSMDENGLVAHGKDGTCVERNTDGSVVRHHSDGSKTENRSDGTTLVHDKDDNLTQYTAKDGETFQYKYEKGSVSEVTSSVEGQIYPAPQADSNASDAQAWISPPIFTPPSMVDHTPLNVDSMIDGMIGSTRADTNASDAQASTSPPIFTPPSMVDYTPWTPDSMRAAS